MSGSPSTSSIKKNESSYVAASLTEQKSDVPIKTAISKIQDIGSQSDRKTAPIEPADATAQQSPRSSTDQKTAIVTASGASPIASTSFPAQPLPSPTPIIHLSGIQPKGQVRETISLPKTLDPGLKVALDYFIEVYKAGAKKNDEHSKLIVQSIFLDSEEQVIATIKSWDNKSKKTLIEENLTIASKDGQILLDALRLAALQGRFVLLRYLLDLKEECHFINETDKEDPLGLNLAHFIALNCSGVFPLKDIPLITNLCALANKSGATPRDFAQWVSEPEPTPIPAFGIDQPTLTPQEYQQITGSNYWIRPCFTPGALLRLCYETPTIESPSYLSTFLNKKITHYVESCTQLSCKLKIKKMQGTSIPKELQGQWECLSSHDVKKGEVLALYSGKVMNRRWTNPAQLSEKTIKLCEGFYLDAGLGGGGLAQFINHGFPNCAFFHHLYRGFPVVAIIALENLKADTPLFLHYGPSYFKDETITRITLNPLEIDQYLIATNNLKKIPFLEFAPDGKQYFYGDRGKTATKKSKDPASEENAIDGFSNKIRLQYLASYHLDEMKTKLENPTFRWLVKEFTIKK